MIYYMCAMIFPLLVPAMFPEKLHGKMFKRFAVLLAILPMFLLFVLRHKTMGVDTEDYVLYLRLLKPYTYKSLIYTNDFHVEIGFLFYTKFISTFTSNYTVYFLLNGLIIFGAIYYFTEKYVDNPFAFLFLFVALGTYNFVYSGLRQSLAMAICLLAVPCIQKKKLIGFGLWVFLAYLFHKSAIVFVLAYPLSSLKKSGKTHIIYASLAIVLVAGFAFFQDLLNSWLGYDYDIEKTDSGYIFFVVLFCLFIASYLLCEGDKNEQVFYNLSLITLIFWAGRLVSRTAERVSFYFIMGFYCYASLLFTETTFKSKENAMIVKLIVPLLCIAFFIYKNWGATYLFFWQ